jgi:hypothetical protein
MSPLPLMTGQPTIPCMQKSTRGPSSPSARMRERRVCVKSAWRKVGIHPWSPKAVLEDPEAQAFLREQDEQERRVQARRSGHPMTPRSQETLSELQRLSVSPDVQEGSSPVRRLATVAPEQEAELAVTKQQLHKALAAQKLTPTSRKVLSRARHV